MTSLLKLTALRQLNLTDSMELTQGRFAQLATLSSLHALCLRDCFELRVSTGCARPALTSSWLAVHPSAQCPAWV